MKTFLEYWNIGPEEGGTKVVSVYAGRFMPFHTGHYQAFLELAQTFDQNNSFIVTADVPKKMGDPSRYPFRFNEKEFIIKTMFGIPDNKIVFDPQVYVPQTLLKKYDQDDDILIVGLSEKDMKEDPRFNSFTKKDGTPSYFQMFKSYETSKSFRHHGYIYTLKEYPVDVNENIRQAGIQNPDEEKYALETVSQLFPKGQVSGTLVRQAWASLGERDRKYILMALYGRYNDKVENLFNKKLV